MSPGSGAGLIHLSAEYGPTVDRGWSFLNWKSVPPSGFMNTVCEFGWVGVR